MKFRYSTRLQAQRLLFLFGYLIAASVLAWAAPAASGGMRSALDHPVGAVRAAR
ncbi:MAG: hypothetical protein HYV17_05980 [Xanthomonadales bacterium]|nr:hypothetical protein [Xanthomonadales bacterium]